MELSELTKKFKTLLGIDDVSEAPGKILNILSGDNDEVFTEWLEFCPDMSTDYLQPIFQYYMADRKEKMQDYTPKTLAKALCKIAGVQNGGKVYDMCAGSGALTIQAWNINKDCEFICQEFDGRVIPFLLFNLAMRNISATVIHGDVLSEEQFKAYRIEKGGRYSRVIETKTPINISADICISNPPYNMKFSLPPFSALNERYKYGLPPESNANYAFISSAIQSSECAALILPTGVLSTENQSEKMVREEIVKNNLVDTVVIAPDKMFEATSIGTCILSFKKERQTATVAMVDMRQTYTEETREQNGQFGGSSHENRTYQKTIKTFSDIDIEKMLEVIEKRNKIDEFSAFPNIEEIKQNDYILIPSRYVSFSQKEAVHRDYSDIMKDINRIIAEKNSCKLVINETLAKALGFDVSLYKNDLKSFNDEQNSFYEKISGQKMLKADYIQFTKNKGEFTLKSNDPEHLSTIFMMAVQMWKQHIMFLNEQENIFLAEMRDALIPDLMTGKIDVNS